MPPLPATDLKALQEQNRAALVEAIKRRNDLHVEVERLEQRTATLEREATEALRDGNRGTAKLRLQAKVAAEQELQARRGELAGVETNAEDIKRSIRDTEELLRIQPPEPAKLPVVTVEGTSSAVPLTVRDTLDTLASGDDGPPITSDVAATDVSPETVQDSKPLAEVSVLTPSYAFFDFSPAFETVIAARAAERDLTTEEYVSTVKQSLAALTELILPLNAPEPPVSDFGRTDPVVQVVEDAVRELKVNQIERREYTVRVLTQKNNLDAEVGRQSRIIAEYERKALAASNGENHDLARQLFNAKRPHEQIRDTMQFLLVQATDVAEMAKQLICQEEERIRVRVTKVLLLRANLTATAIAFQLDTLRKEVDPQENVEDDFDAWIHAQQSASPE